MRIYGKRNINTNIDICNKKVLYNNIFFFLLK